MLNGIDRWKFIELSWDVHRILEGFTGTFLGYNLGILNIKGMLVHTLRCHKTW